MVNETRSHLAHPFGTGLLVVFAQLLAACTDTSDTIAVPATVLEPGRTQAPTGPGSTVPDAATNASAGPEDAGATNGPAPTETRTCPGPLLAADGVVSLFSFEEEDGATVATDVISGHNAAIENGSKATVPGPAGCGDALAFGATPSYLQINDDDAWDLDAGAIDLWFWLPAVLPDHVGILSRDRQNRDDPGHISLFIDVEGRAQVRIQPQEEEGSDNTTDAVSCSAVPIPREQWVHIGINFGPPAVELYIDGELAVAEGSHAFSDEWSCGQAGDYSIAGNDLPWIVGRSALHSGDGADLLEFPAAGCAIDELRITSSRQDFGNYF